MRHSTPFLFLVFLLACSLPCPETRGDEVEVTISDGGPPAACRDRCVCCGSPWSFSGGAIILQRGDLDSVVLMEDTTDPNRQLNTDAFDFDFRAGWEFNLGRDFGWGRRLEGRVFGVDAWNPTATAVTNSTLLNPLQINSSPPIFAPNVQDIDAAYGTDLLSAEVNWLRPGLGNWTSLIGFRYFELDEALFSQLNAGGQTFRYDVGTQNRLFGFQAGMMLGERCVRGWRTSAQLKAAVYANAASHSSRFETGAATALAAESADKTAFSGELIFTGVYDIDDSWSLRLGYNLLWLESVAVAADQIAVSNFVTNSGIDSSGGVFFHGASIGLEYWR